LLRIGRDSHSKGLEDRLIKSEREAMMQKPIQSKEKQKTRGEEKGKRRGEGSRELQVRVTVDLLK
jgi:hypothetical protein